jgi:prevent-host-death family protein
MVLIMSRFYFYQDTQNLSEFRSGAASFIRQINETRRPIVITQRGKGVAVVLDVAEYEAMQEKIELLKLPVLLIENNDNATFVESIPFVQDDETNTGIERYSVYQNKKAKFHVIAYRLRNRSTTSVYFYAPKIN